MHDHGCGARFFQPLQRLDAIVVATDQSIDIDARNRTRRRERAASARYRNHANGDDGSDREKDCHAGHTTQNALPAPSLSQLVRAGLRFCLGACLQERPPVRIPQRYIVPIGQAARLRAARHAPLPR